MRKIGCVILVLFFVFAAAFAGYQIYREYTERQESADSYTDLKELVSFPEVPPSEDSNETISTESGETQAPNNDPTIDFDALLSINSDCVGWIHIPDTGVSYPVVQGSDNSHYLKHLFNGKWNSGGCIFMDCRVNALLSDRHSIIYGHHMKDGTMFSGLTKYKKQQYYNEHPDALFITPVATYRIEFFSGYVAKVSDPAWQIVFESDEVYEAWLKDVDERSWFESPLSPAVTDRILTLSTCSYEFDNARFVLHGIIREEIAATD